MALQDASACTPRSIASIRTISAYLDAQLAWNIRPPGTRPAKRIKGYGEYRY